jgi:hypothetical protein
VVLTRTFAALAEQIAGPSSDHQNQPARPPEQVKWDSHEVRVSQSICSVPGQRIGLAQLNWILTVPTAWGHPIRPSAHGERSPMLQLTTTTIDRDQSSHPGPATRVAAARVAPSEANLPTSLPL